MLNDDKLALIAESHARVTGRALVGSAHGLREALWNAASAIVAHGAGADPVFFYGNRTALKLFEMDWASFVQMPSRLSAEPLLRDERAQLLERVTRDGFISDYSGIRISSSGKRFRIERATVWNLLDGNGICHGQAATFDRWRPA